MSKTPRVRAGDKRALRFILSRIHVGTSDAEVEADVRKRIAKSSTVGPKQYEDALVACALDIHHEHQDLYRIVNGAI